MASCRACGVRSASEFEDVRVRRLAAYVPVDAGGACKSKPGVVSAEARMEKERADSVKALSQREAAFGSLFSLRAPGVVASARPGKKKDKVGKAMSAPTATARVTPARVASTALDLFSVGGKRNGRSKPSAAGVCERGSLLEWMRLHVVLGEGNSLLASKVGTKLLAMDVETEVVEAFLAQILLQFGDGAAWELLDGDDNEWFLVWDRWAAFSTELTHLRSTWDCEECPFVDHVKTLLQELLFVTFRIVDAQVPATQVTNAERLAVLEARGFSKQNGQVWGENDCLADSLLQLMIWSHVVRAGVDRKLACVHNRLHLELQPVLVPRSTNGAVNLGGMLQHHRHAAATLRFFLDWFACDTTSFPAAGVRLSVHARYDGDVCSDVDVICVGLGTGAGGPLFFDLFNSTGEDYRGYHYDPLVHVDGPVRDVVVALDDDDDDDDDAGDDDGDLSAAIALFLVAGAATPDVAVQYAGEMKEGGALDVAMHPSCERSEENALGTCGVDEGVDHTTVNDVVDTGTVPPVSECRVLRRPSAMIAVPDAAFSETAASVAAPPQSTAGDASDWKVA